MIKTILKRVISTIITLILVSIVTFIVIELPPGDYAERYAFKLEAGGVAVTESDLQSLRIQFGLDRPAPERYFKWISNIIFYGDFGVSYQYQRPVIDVIGERFLLTVVIALTTILFTYGLAIPIGIYSAVKQYSIGDYLATIIGYLGLAIPNFMLALFVMYFSVKCLGLSVGGLFSPEFQTASWSWARVLDIFKHLWVPALVLGLSRSAFQIRTVRATLLDEKNKLYVTAARAKGMPEFKLLMKYPVRAALNPIVSTLGWELALIVSGTPIVSVVLSLPDTGPLFLNSLLDQDMYLAGGMLLMLAVITIIGTFISDLLLILIDPRVRHGKSTQ